MTPQSLFYATYYTPKPGYTSPSKPHARRVFHYSQEEMLAFGTRNGFQARYIGDWNHPRDQVLVEYRV